MDALLWITVAAPLAGALAVRWADVRLAAAAAVLSAAPAWLLLVAAAGGERARSTFAWLPGLDAGLRLDGLSAVMAATVATVGLLVVVYATGYFAAEPRRASALAGLLGFLAVMQGLVLADGYLALLVFWELVGAASARLIAFSRDDPAAAPGAVRAFLTTRAADTGLYVALLALFAAHGSLAFGLERPDGGLGALVGLGLVLAAMGKSAQAPLQTWLSGAMAGPTPVSALLHSATMVAAGVYLLARSYDLLAGWPVEVAGWVGAITAVVAAAIALAQPDIKRVLAGSTASQLGLMFVGLAAGGPVVAVFHLVAQAAGKAGLFLAAGIFQHDRGSVALEDLRGAGRDNPRAFWLFAVCAASVAAIPPFAAFWSKDAVVVAAEVNAGWFVLVLLSAAGSAAYLLRVVLVLRAPAPPRPARPAPVMLAPAALLALGAAALGLAGEPLRELLGGELPASLPSVLLSLLAIAVGAAALRIRPPRALARAARDEFHTRALLAGAFTRPARGLARLAARFDDRVVDGAIDATGRGALAAARASETIERRGIDAAVDGIAVLVGRGGSGAGEVQTGRLHEYLRDALLGGVAVAAVIATAALT